MFVTSDLDGLMVINYHLDGLKVINYHVGGLMVVSLYHLDELMVNIYIIIIGIFILLSRESDEALCELAWELPAICLPH